VLRWRGAAQIIYVIDGRSWDYRYRPRSGQDAAKLGKPVTLAVNKIDSLARESLLHEFHSVGLRTHLSGFGEHRLGFDDLLVMLRRIFRVDVPSASSRRRS